MATSGSDHSSSSFNLRGSERCLPESYLLRYVLAFAGNIQPRRIHFPEEKIKAEKQNET